MAYSPKNPNGQAAMAASEPVVIASDQSAVPVSGTVTANLSATDNAVLDAIEVDTTTIAGAVSGTEMQVDVLTMPTTTVQATNLDIRDLTQASDAILVYGSDDGGTTKRVIKTDAGGAIQVDLEVANVGVTSIAAGDNNIGNVDVVTMPTVAVTGTFWQATQPVSATDLDIRNLTSTDIVTIVGDVGTVDQLDLTNTNPLAVAIVDGDGTQITSFGGGTQYTEDAAAAANPVGTAVNLIRSDTPATQTTTDGDNVAQRGTNYGAAYVQLVTSAGAYIDSVGGGTQYSDADANADPTGTVAMGTDGSNIFAVHTDTSGDLQVDILTAPTLTVNTHAVTATDLDIRDLTSVSDSITIVPSGTQAVSNAGLTALNGAISGTEVQVDVLTMPTTTVTATDLDIRNLVAATDIVDLGGNALTSLQLSDDVIKTLGTDTYTETTTKGTLIGAVRRDADTTLVDTTNEIAPLQVDANGRLKVEVFSGETLPVSLTSTTITGSVAVTQSGTWDEVGINDSGNSITVDYATTGSGTATGALRVELPTNGTGVVGLNAGTNNIGDVDVLTINGVAPAFNTGVRGATVQRVTIATDDIVPASQSGTWTVQPGNTANTTAWLTSSRPAASGGLSKFHLVGAATDNATNVKASAGQVYAITAFNLNAAPRYLKFHNTASTPTAGSGVTDTFLIPGNTAGAGLVINFDNGIAFGTGIGITLVTGIADNNTTAIAASEVVINIYYA